MQVKCLRFMACARNKLWWMTPEWGTTMSELPTETQFLLLQHGRKGPYTAILPLITRSGFRATLKADRNKCASHRYRIHCCEFRGLMCEQDGSVISHCKGCCIYNIDYRLCVNLPPQEESLSAPSRAAGAR